MGEGDGGGVTWGGVVFILNVKTQQGQNGTKKKQPARIEQNFRTQIFRRRLVGPLASPSSREPICAATRTRPAHAGYLGF